MWTYFLFSISISSIVKTHGRLFTPIIRLKNLKTARNLRIFWTRTLRRTLISKSFYNCKCIFSDLMPVESFHLYRRRRHFWDASSRFVPKAEIVDVAELEDSSPTHWENFSPLFYPSRYLVLQQSNEERNRSSCIGNFEGFLDTVLSILSIMIGEITSF